MVQIEITSLIFHAQYGAMFPGDIARVSETEAARLVNERKAAKYVDHLCANQPPVKRGRRKSASQ